MTRCSLEQTPTYIGQGVCIPLYCAAHCQSSGAVAGVRWLSREMGGGVVGGDVLAQRVCSLSFERLAEWCICFFRFSRAAVHVPYDFVWGVWSMRSFAGRGIDNLNPRCCDVSLSWIELEEHMGDGGGAKKEMNDSGMKSHRGVIQGSFGFRTACSTHRWAPFSFGSPLPSASPRPALFPMLQIC
ncbi:hypothetical protein BD779DRAFT_1044299 [Infundibulicybe gibba]|nr:hypothetical protein BD779DRAFT_1044299 [Infundibulicybe gibba]